MQLPTADNNQKHSKKLHYSNLIAYLIYQTWTQTFKGAKATGRKDSNKCVQWFNPLNPELNPICYLLALLGAHHFLHVSRITVKFLTFRLLMSHTHIYIYIYIYMEHPFLIFLDHTQRRTTVGRTPLDE